MRIPNLKTVCGLVVATSFLLAQRPMPQAPADPADPTNALRVLVGSGRAGVEEAWTNFQVQEPGPWRAHWCAATGTPHAIYGAGLTLADWRGNTIEEARRHALRLLQERAELLGLGTSEFRESIGARMGRTWSFKFDQYFRGLPVIDGRADVRVSMAGRIAMFGSRAWPIPADFPTVPTLGEEAATLIAWRALGEAPPAQAQPGRARQPRLVLFGDVMAPKLATPDLAWEVPVSAVRADGSGPIGRYYVDAASGRVIEYRSDKHECGIPGCSAGTCVDAETTPAPVALPVPPKPVVPEAAPVAAAEAAAVPVLSQLRVWAYTQVGASATAPAQMAVMPFMDVDIDGQPYRTDANGDIFVDLTQSAQCTARFDGSYIGPITGPNGGTVAGALAPGSYVALVFFDHTATPEQLAHSNTYYWVNRASAFARNVLGNSPQLAVLDQITTQVNLVGDCNAYYGNNNMQFYQPFSTCRNTAFSSIIAHEWGHGLDAVYGTIHPWNGLGEAYADVVANYLLDDPVIARDGITVSPFHFRSSVNSVQFPNGASQHEQGQSFAGFAWQLRAGLETWYISRPWAIDISNDIVIGSLVADALTQPEAVLEVCIADDTDGNLANGTPHIQVITQAAAAHSLPMPSMLPPNDDCATALTLVEGVNGPFDNRYASTQHPYWLLSGTRAGVADLWFRYTAGTTGNLRVSLCNRAPFDTLLAVYSGSCSSLALLAQNDNACGTQSEVNVVVGPGTYYVRVGSAAQWNGWAFLYGAGSFDVEVNGPGGSTAALGYYGNPCMGSLPGAPPLIYGALPRFGTTVPIVTTPWPFPQMFGFQAIGFLPYVPGLDLGAYGAPGCELLVAPVATELVFAPSGVSTYNFAIPHDSSLQGLALHAQTFLLAPGANAVGLISSDGLGLTIGS